MYVCVLQKRASVSPRPRPGALQQGALVPDAIAGIALLIIIHGVVTVSVRGVILVIDEELGEYAQVEQQSAETAGQPGSINEHIPAVYPALLAGLAFRVATHGVIGEDAEDVGQVAQAGEEEEENADTLGGLAPEIQEELGEARPEV